MAPAVQYTASFPFELHGSESQIMGISKELSRAGHEVLVAGRFGASVEPLAKNTSRVRFIDVSSRKLPSDAFAQLGSTFAYSRAVYRLIGETTPDIVSLNERFSAYFPSKSGIPKVFTTHNPDAMGFFRAFAIENNGLNLFFFGLKKRVEETVMARCDVVVALTKAIEAYLHHRGFWKTAVIPNAVNESDYYNRSDEGYVLYAGRLARIKGLPLLIDAFSQLRESTGWRLILVGSGPEEARLKSLAASKGLHGRVEFVPLVPRRELSHFLARCSVFVLPSWHEGMPVTLLEAMASSKPVIASNIPGPADMIDHGVSGLLFERGNAEDLARFLAICSTDSDLRRRLGAGARKAVETNYTFGRISGSYDTLFRRIRGESND